MPAPRRGAGVRLVMPRARPNAFRGAVDHRRRRAELDGFGKPVAEVAFDPGGIDENAVFAIADQLAAQIDLERR